METTNKNFQIKATHALFNSAKRSGARCDIFVFEPQNIESMELGTLYVVGQIIQPDEASGHLLNLISSILKREFFSRPDRGAQTSLELALHRANMALAEFAQQESIDWMDKLNISCAVINNSTLLTTNCGQSQIFIWRENSLVDLGKKITLEVQKPHPSKTFRNVASGRVLLGDKIILATPTILDVVSTKGLEQLLSDDSSTIIERIKAMLAQQPHVPSLAILILELASPAETMVVKGGQPYGKTIVFAETPQTESSNIQRTLRPAYSRTKALTEKIKSRAMNASLRLVQLSKRISLSKIKMPALQFEATSSSETDTDAQPKKILRMTKSRLITVAIILAIALGGYLINLKLNNNKKELAQYTALLQDVSKKQNEIEAALIFNDVNRASVGILAAEDLAKKISQLKSKSQEGLDLQKKLSEQFDSINKVNRIAQPPILADFSKSNFSFTPQSLAISGDNIYALMPKNTAVYQFTQTTNSGRYLLSGIDSSATSTKPIIFDQYIINEKGQLIKMVGKRKSAPLSTNFFPELKTGMKVVAPQNLYILDSANQRIVVLDKKGILQKQIISDSLSGIIDLTITPDEKTGFALSQNRLFEIRF